MQEVEFVLQNFFIVRPNKSSAYKLKIVINHETSQQKYKDSQSKYKFKFSINDHLLEKPYGFISLLEKVNSTATQNANYLQIGKGQLDFNDIITNTKDNNISTLNGVIYGTRATNFDKLIAKYGYQIIKSHLELQRINKLNKQSLSTNTIKFKNHKLSQKLPSIKLNQSILEQSNQINSKIRKLTSTIMQQNEDQRTVQYSQTTISPKQTISRSDFKYKQSQDQQTNIYYVKMNGKIQNAIFQQKLNGLRWVQIKNIKINKYQPHQKDTDIYKSDYLLLKIIQNTFNKLFQIIIKIKFNVNNQLFDLFFPTPIQLQTVTFQITFMQAQVQLLLGTLRMGSSINKIIELNSSTTNEEIGFINIEILKNNPQDYNLSAYQEQIEQFNHYYKQFSNKLAKQHSFHRYTPSINPALSSPIRQYRSIQQPSRQRFYTSTNKQNGIQRLANVPVSLKKNKAINLSQMQKIATTPKIVKRTETQQLPLNSLSLKINNIYLNLYDQTEDYIFLKFVSKDHSQVKQVQNGFNIFDQSDSLVLDNLYQNQQIRIMCYSAHSNQKAHLLGKCSISVRSIITSTTNQVKIFITNNNCFIGFMMLELSLYRIKNNKIRSYKKSQLAADSSLNQQQYEFQLSPNQVRHTQNLSSKFRHGTDLNSSFIVEQQNFR